LIASKLGFSVRIVIALSVGLVLGGHASAQIYVVKDSSAKSVIVLQNGAQGLYRHSAEELQKYIGRLTGVRPEIVGPQDISGRPKDEALLVVGGPEANELAKKAAEAGKVNFSNLKPEGFLVKTIKLGERPALVIGGNDEAGTLYGTYDWLERQGIAFQITGDIIPQTKASLPLSPLDVRSEPAFTQRGFGIASCYETRSIWSYPDIVRFIDQMAKLKLNYLIWHMFSPEPYLEESFEGERKLMGDEASWQGGYTLPAYDFGSHKVEDYFVGKEAFEKFGKKYMAPDEWQGVKDQDQVYATARDLLQRVIQYAKTRNIKVWVALESLDELAPNLARYTRRPEVQLPYSPYHAAYACPTDENLYKINEIRFKALVQSYPEAEGFIFWLNEGYPVCQDPEDQELVKNERSKYAGVPDLVDKYYKSVARFQTTDSAVANSVGSVHLVQKIVEVRDQVSPNTKIGIGLWGRAYLLPTLDKVLPKDVLIVDNETSGVWTPDGVPMQLYGGMGERNRIFMHVGDDDTGMIGMQFHVRLYYRDRMLEGSLENGVQGVTELGDRFRGEEHLAKYLADGAWNPRLTPDQFYHDYARRIFGERAEAPMFQAFMSLEDMEGYKGYHSNKPDHITLMACCSPPDELKIAKEYAEQPNPYDGPVFEEWQSFVKLIPAKIDLLSGELALEKQALSFMKVAEATAAPGSLDELHYLENKTKAYAQMIEAFIQFDQACAEFNSAFQLDRRIQRQEFVARLDESLRQFQKAKITARYSAETWSKVIDNVSDLGVLWRLNTFVVTGMDLVSQFMQNIDNYHHGKFYLNQVAWERVFSPLPILTKRTGFERPEPPKPVQQP
jgi:hypothetical protein